MRRSVRKRCQHHNRKKVCTPSSAAFTARPLSSRSVTTDSRPHKLITCSVEAFFHVHPWRRYQRLRIQSSAAATLQRIAVCAIRSNKVSSQLSRFFLLMTPQSLHSLISSKIRGKTILCGAGKRNLPKLSVCSITGVVIAIMHEDRSSWDTRRARRMTHGS
jgi:hypothetical protein